MQTPSFLAGGGEMGALMRAHQWSTTSLGQPETWPQSLRLVIRLMLNSGHPMYIWWGKDLACFYNDAYRRSIGPERHPGSLGRPAREVWEEIWDIIGPQIEQVIEGRGATWHEDQLVAITRNGKREDVYWTYSFSPIDDPAAPNGVGGILVVCTETTRQVLAAQKSRDDLARFAALFHEAPIFIALVRGPEHRFELANPAYQRLVGNRPLLGKTVLEALPEVATQGYVALLDRVRDTGEPYIATGAAFSIESGPDGAVDERQLDFVYQPIRDDRGAVSAIIIVGVDVTGRSTADITAQRLASIVASSDDAIVSKDLNGTIQTWNAGAERIFGFTAAEAVGKPITIVIPPDRLHEETDILRRISSGERVDHFETMRQHKDGTLVPVSVTISPIRDREGRIVGASKVGRDITANKKMQEMQSLLFREMQHRIKNLFAVAAGVVMLSTRDATGTKELARMINARLTALSRAQDLTLSGIASNKATLAELARVVLSPYDQDGVHLRIEGPAVDCGPQGARSFALLVHEFATNSVKYGALSQPGGHVTITWEDGDTIALQWREFGGPTVAAPADSAHGFGGILIDATVSELGGTIERAWQPEGLIIRLNLARARLAA